MALSRSATLPGSTELAWEIEVNAGKHLGQQDHLEVSFAIVARVHSSSEGLLFRSSFAVGEGLSVASSIPTIERVRHAPAVSRVLNYLMFEVTLGPEQPASPELAVRIHHRSGIGGIINDVSGGSNAVLLGLKFRF